MATLIDKEEAARRLARVIVSDIKLYNANAIARGEDLTPRILEGFTMFKGRVTAELHGVFETVLRESGLEWKSGVHAMNRTSSPPAPREARPPASPLPAPEVTPAPASPPPAPLAMPAGASVETPLPASLRPTPVSLVSAQVAEKDHDRETPRTMPVAAEAPPAEPQPTPALLPAPTQKVAAPRGQPAANETAPLERTPPPLERTPPPLERTPPPLERTPPPLERTPPPLPAQALKRPETAPLPLVKPQARPEAHAPPPAPLSVETAPPTHSLTLPPAALVSAALLPEQEPTAAVPNLKPPFPWVKLLLALAIAAAAVAGLVHLTTS
ncbi:MAG: hypothetical protein KA712_04375 [Myxococcales bacterium]|nr:hypothetical protein [Myxococcales bacterium]